MAFKHNFGIGFETLANGIVSHEPFERVRWLDKFNQATQLAFDERFLKLFEGLGIELFA